MAIKYISDYIIDKMISIARELYEMIPSRFRWIISPFVYCFVFLTNLRLDLYYVEGEEANSRMQLSVLVSGRPQDRSYLLGLIYGTSYRERHVKSYWLWDISRAIDELGSSCSMVLVEVTNFRSHRKLLGKENWIYIPRWIWGEVDIPCSPVVMKHESVKGDLKRIRKNSLEFEITKDPQRFDEFYHNMYKPYITNAHGEGAFIEAYNTLKRKFQNGELLLVKKQDKYIAGVMILYEDAAPHNYCIGILDGNREYLNYSAIGAVNYFSFLHLAERGFKKVNLGPTRPFLRNGVLRSKRKWSLRITGPSSDSFALKVISDTPAIRAFLMNNPFIFEKKGLLYGAVFVDTEMPLSSEIIKLIDKDLFFPGLSLSKLFIYCFGPCNVIKQDIVPSECSEYIELRSADDVFAEHTSYNDRT